MLEFGLTKKRVKKVEKYPKQAVLTYLGGEKVSNFQFNKKAMELMGYEGKDRKVSLGFDENGYIFLANTSNIETIEQNHVTAKDYFANSLLVKKIASEYEIFMNEGFEFPLLMPTEPSEGIFCLLISKERMEISQELNEIVTDTTDVRNEVASEEDEVYGGLESAYDEPNNGEIRENAFMESQSVDPRYGAIV